jgi:hypothetical protein
VCVNQQDKVKLRHKQAPGSEFLWHLTASAYGQEIRRRLSEAVHCNQSLLC